MRKRRALPRFAVLYLAVPCCAMLLGRAVSGLRLLRHATIKVSHAACEDEFRLNFRPHS